MLFTVGRVLSAPSLQTHLWGAPTLAFKRKINQSAENLPVHDPDRLFDPESRPVI
jgi:hypothetical protein